MKTTSKPIVTGTLGIREIVGRNGPFKVGTLNTPIGKFAVKDPILDQYEPGSYEGEFEIDAIYQGHYIAGDRSVTEIRAKLGNINIADINEKEPEPPVIEPDPIDDKPEPVKQKTEKDKTDNGSKKDKDDDASLFGLLIPLGESVKLDPSVDRKLLRAQIDRLQELGYEFDAKCQTWKKR